MLTGDWTGGISMREQEVKLLECVLIKKVVYDYDRKCGWQWEVLFDKKTYSSGTNLFSSVEEASRAALEFAKVLRLSLESKLKD